MGKIRVLRGWKATKVGMVRNSKVEKEKRSGRGREGRIDYGEGMVNQLREGRTGQGKERGTISWIILLQTIDGVYDRKRCRMASPLQTSPSLT